MIKVTKKDGESSEKLLKRFSNHVKSRRLIFRVRAKRYFAQKLTKKKVRASAIVREKYRALNKKKQFIL